MDILHFLYTESDNDDDSDTSLTELLPELQLMRDRIKQKQIQNDNDEDEEDCDEDDDDLHDLEFIFDFDGSKNKDNDEDHYSNAEEEGDEELDGDDENLHTIIQFSSPSIMSAVSTSNAPELDLYSSSCPARLPSLSQPHGNSSLQIPDVDETDASDEEDPQIVIASLRQELKTLREQSDQEYAVAITIAAKERDAMKEKIEKLEKEKEALSSENTLQQAHIDVLTQELCDTQQQHKEKKRRRKRRSKTKINDLEKSKEQIEIRNEILVTSIREFQSFFQRWMSPEEDEREPNEDESREQEEDISYVDDHTNEKGHDSETKLKELRQAVATLEASTNNAIIEDDCLQDIRDFGKENDHNLLLSLDLDDKSSNGSGSLHRRYQSLGGILQKATTETDDDNANSGIMQASFIQKAVVEQQIRHSWFGFGSSSTNTFPLDSQDLTKQFISLRKETDNDFFVALTSSRRNEPGLTPAA